MPIFVVHGIIVVVAWTKHVVELSGGMVGRMAISRTQETRVGIVTVVALAVLIGGIVWGKGFIEGVHQQVPRIDFPRANGIDVGGPVTLYGVRKGSVTKIEVREGGVRVTATVEPSVPLHPDTKATLQMGELTGGKTIELDPGKAPGELPGGAVIPGTVKGDVADLLGTVDQIGKDAQIVLHRLDSALLSVTDVIGDPALRRGIKSTVTNLEQASASANQLVAANRPAISQTIKNLNELSRDLREIGKRADAGIDRTLGTVDGISQDARIVITDAGSAVRRADTLVARLDRIVQDIEKGDGTISMLLHDEQFARDLQATIRNVRQYLEEVQKNGVVLRHKIGF
jgi:phospholipid/cholesterol/gamma-HCH transport system substrate-binding protein